MKELLYNNPISFLTRKMWEYSSGNRKSVVFYIVLFICANTILLFEPLVIAKVLNTIQDSGITQETLPSIIGLLSILVAISFVFWVFHGPARVLERNNAFIVRAQYKNYLLKGTLDLDAEWHTNHHSGDTIDKIEKGTKALHDFSEGGFIILSSIIKLLGSFIALALFNVHTSYIVLLALVAAFTIVAQMDKKIMGQYRVLNKAENKISEKIFDTISNITTVIILRVEALVLKTLNTQIMKPFPLHRTNARWIEWKWFGVSMMAAFVTFGILTTHIYFSVQAGAVLMIGTLFALYDYGRRITGVFFEFASMYSTIVRQRASVANAEELSKDFKEQKHLSHGNLPEDWQELAIRNLSFSYHSEEGAELHLRDINVRLEQGARIALIGDSGSGKSTFLKIMRDLYTPSELTVALDGKKLSKGIGAISEDVSLVPQDPEIFATTIGENITIGVPYTDEEIRTYTDMARFSEVVERLPNGLESSVVEKGVNLSGGEKQRLALARGLLASQDKQIVLLDEPTSSVDSKNERAIYENIFTSFKDKTILSSVHRLHLLTLFDHIYYFSQGRIIAEGNFEQLKETSKEFQVLWQKYVANEGQNDEKS